MGILNIYKLQNKSNFSDCYAEIEDWGSLFMLYIYLPSGKKYCESWCKSLKSAKIRFTKAMDKKGAIWKIDNSWLKGPQTLV